MTKQTATLLISCPDQRGLVAKFANFIYANGGNITHADQHTDGERFNPQRERFRKNCVSKGGKIAFTKPCFSLWQ